MYLVGKWKWINEPVSLIQYLGRMGNETSTFSHWREKSRPSETIHFWSIFVAVRLPIPAYLLAMTYFYMSLLSLMLLAGLRTQRTRLLLCWLLFTLITQFPEGGMVLFMAIYYWVRIWRLFPALLIKKELNIFRNDFKRKKLFQQQFCRQRDISTLNLKLCT